jgi:hypothetical protein
MNGRAHAAKSVLGLPPGSQGSADAAAQDHEVIVGQGRAEAGERSGMLDDTLIIEPPSRTRRAAC